jgi:hypothetical protein
VLRGAIAVVKMVVTRSDKHNNATAVIRDGLEIRRICLLVLMMGSSYVGSCLVEGRGFKSFPQICEVGGGGKLADKC